MFTSLYLVFYSISSHLCHYRNDDSLVIGSSVHNRVGICIFCILVIIAAITESPMEWIGISHIYFIFSYSISCMELLLSDIYHLLTMNSFPAVLLLLTMHHWSSAIIQFSIAFSSLRILR
jgi:hypothetical protein